MEAISLLSFHIYDPNLTSSFENSLVFLSLLLIRKILSFCSSFPIDNNVVFLSFNSPINTLPSGTLDLAAVIEVLTICFIF